MHKPYLSPNFQSNGINSLPVDGRMFMASFTVFSMWDTSQLFPMQ